MARIFNARLYIVASLILLFISFFMIRSLMAGEKDKGKKKGKIENEFGNRRTVIWLTVNVIPSNQYDESQQTVSSVITGNPTSPCINDSGTICAVRIDTNTLPSGYSFVGKSIAQVRSDGAVHTGEDGEDDPYYSFRDDL